MSAHYTRAAPLLAPSATATYALAAMPCPRCHRPIPDGAIVCPTCSVERARPPAGGPGGFTPAGGSGREDAPRTGPLDGAALARLIREQVRSGELLRSLPGLVEAAGESTLARECAGEWLRELEERLKPLDPDKLELRLVSGLWIG